MLSCSEHAQSSSGTILKGSSPTLWSIYKIMLSFISGKPPDCIWDLCDLLLSTSLLLGLVIRFLVDGSKVVGILVSCDWIPIISLKLCANWLLPYDPWKLIGHCRSPPKAFAIPPPLLQSSTSFPLVPYKAHCQVSVQHTAHAPRSQISQQHKQIFWSSKFT